jgi:hypothetical protein
MRKTVLTFGLLSGAVSAGMMFITLPMIDTIGFKKAEILGYTSIVLSALLIFFGIRSYRENVAGGRVGFGRGMGVGVLITLVSCLSYVAAFQVIYFKLAPDFGEKFMACMVDQARASGASAAKLEETKKQAETMKRLYDRPLTNAALTFLEPFPIGLVVAAASAGILSRTGRKRTDAETAG